MRLTFEAFHHNLTEPMTTNAPARTPAPETGVPRPTRLGGLGQTAVLGALVGVLALLCLASLAWGTRDVPFPVVLDALLDPVAGNHDHIAVREQRVSRTVIGLLAGAALGVAGALMQGLTRNPIADPGLLGVNSGASLAVIVAISAFDIVSPAGFVWFAFAGAAAAAFLVYAVASIGPGGPTPVKLALVGAAFTAAGTSLITLALLTDYTVLAEYRFWSVGALVNRPMSVVTVVLPAIAVGLVAAVASGRFLNAMSLGEDVARGLGQRVGFGRGLVVLAVVLLCGGATALAGPIAFVGLMVPHVARAIVGPDYRRILPLAAVLGPILLLAADVIGRLVVRDAELEAGIVVAFVGAPVLIWLVRTTRAVSM